MGLIASLFGFGTGRTDDPDPNTGLTSRDRYHITSTWKIVRKDSVGNGIKLFLKLFEIQPEFHKQFPFRNVPIAELPQSKIFQAHCTTVMYSFSTLIDGIEDSELLQNLASNIGFNHAKRGLNDQALKELKQAILGIFTFMNAEQLASWSKFIDLFAGYLKQGVERKNQK